MTLLINLEFYCDLYLGDVYCEFLKANFPDYNKRMVSVPVSFQYKDVRTHGIVSDNQRRNLGETSKDWIKATSGLRAEQQLFDEIHRQFSDQPCLLMNGFSEHDLIKVMKSKLQKKGKCDALSKEVNTKF